MTIFWRLYIGPAYRPDSDDHAFDWSVIDEGDDTYAGPSLFTVLTATLDSGVSTAAVQDATDFPTKGGVFIGPNGSGQAWEYCDFKDRIATTALPDLVREPTATREHNGVHSAGAVVRPWYPVDFDDGRLRLVEQLDSRLGLRTWRIEVSGWNYPQPALRNHHAALVQYRTDPSEDWANLALGWIMTPEFSDDGTYARRWSGSVVCIARLQQDIVSDALRIGELDVAINSTGSSSPTLANAWRESLSGDYIAASPDFSAAAALNADSSDLFIAEQFVGSPNWLWPNSDPNAPLNDGGVILSGIFLERPEGYRSEGYRWIELTAYQTSVKDMIIGREYSNTDGSFPVLDIGFQNYGAGTKILIVENEELFYQENPVTAATYVLELYDPVFWDGIDPDNDSIALFRATAGGAQSGFTWGASATGSIAHPSKGTYTYGAYSKNTKAPKGYCHRYEFGGVSAPQDGTATTPDAYWRSTPILTPGYTVGDYDSDEGTLNESRLDRPYIVLRLPRLGLVLESDITDAYPDTGELLPITDGTAASTEGLVEPIVIQIGGEQIYCSAKAEGGLTVQTRGYNSTTAKDHKAGDTIMVVEETIATDGIPVKRVGWTRRTGGIYPKQFDLYVSRKDNPVEPFSEYWDDDWTLADSESAWASESWETDFGETTYRLTALAIIFKEMSYDPARPRLDNISVVVNEQAYSSDTWMTGTVEAGDVLEQLLENADVPSGAITVQSGTPTVDGFSTASDNLWTLIADYAEYTGLRVSVGRDNKIDIAPDPFFSAASLTAGANITRLTAKRVEYLQTGEGLVSQVCLSWQTGDGETTGEAVYPAEPEFLGRIAKLGPLVYADSSKAAYAAQRRYILLRYPHTIIAELVDGDLDIHAGDIFSLQWQFDDTMQTTSRTVLIETVEHTIDQNVLTTALHGIVLRESF